MRRDVWRGNFRFEDREEEDEYYGSESCKLNWAETVVIGRL